MRLAMYYTNQDIRIQKVPMPAIGAGELLVRVEASGVCGSDVMEWYRRGKTPLVLGHEVSGIVEETGESVTRYKKGDRVVCAHHVPCGTCHFCVHGNETVCDTLRSTNFDPGGFAQYLRLPRINVEFGVLPLPDGVSFEEGTFVEPLGCVVRGQRKAGFKEGQSVLVLGCGVAGLLHVCLARCRGAGVIVATDTVEYRRAQASRFGADEVCSPAECTPQKLRALNEGRLFDLVVVSAGSGSAITQALESIERAATVLFFAPSASENAAPIPFNQVFWRNQNTLTSSYAASPEDSREALELIAQKKVPVRDMVTHRLRLDEIQRGFQLVAEAKESMKVIIYPHQ